LVTIRLFSLVFVLAAAACTSNDSPASTTGGTPPPHATTSEADPPPPTTDAPNPSPVTTQTPSPPTTRGAGGYTPTWEPAACEFNQPEGYQANCGYLVVPQDREDPSGVQVRLHVAVFPAATPTPAPDPVVYLEGGPGGHALEGLEFSFEDRFAPFLERRALVVFDQRGVGFSTPALSCPELRALDIELLDDILPPTEYTSREIEALQACRDRLTADGVDITQYNSRTNAADVADLRIALGVDEWNLYGISYGTRLALTAMRDNPAGVRSVILDSSVPLQADLVSSVAATADRAFAEFFSACGSSPACAATFPGLEAEYNAVRSRLDADAANIEVTDFLTGDSYPAVLTGDDVTGLLFQSLYSEQLLPILPDVISDAADGDLEGMEQLASLFFTNDRFISIGMYFAVQCNEEYPFSTVEMVEDAVAAYPDAAPLFRDIPGEFQECATWGSGTADDVEDDPVASDLPTLIMGGVFDPITPPQFGRDVAATLPNSYFFEYPGLGHGVSTAHPCPLGMTLAFLDDPSSPPDDACIADMGPPMFLTPGNISVELVPFEEDIFELTVTGLVPTGWDSAGFGQYTAPGLGDTAIVQQARVAGGGLTVDSMAAGIGDFFDIADWNRTTRSSAGRTWNLFEGTDGELRYLMALVVDNGFMLTVILASPDDVHSEYRDLVFLPALDAIEARG
jgi:pimeloyl-ACP methyl ester carboxylesterase